MIDSRAVVDTRAEIAAGVTVGPYAVIGADVAIADGTWIGPHAVINGPTSIGRDNKIYQFASVGDAPQDKKYGGEPTRLEIGDRNVIRECTTINRGTVQDAGVTRLGNDNWIMAYVHIAHDCQVGSQTVFANNASLAGHVNIEDYVILGGFTQIHQFCSLGTYAFTAFGTGLSKDVPPYVMVSGHPAKPHGLNQEGLRRQGFSKEAINQLRQAYKVLYRCGLRREEALGQLQTMAKHSPEVAYLARFLETHTERGIVR